MSTLSPLESIKSPLYDPSIPEASAERAIRIPTHLIRSNPFSISIYGDPDAETDDLLESVRQFGILVPLVVVNRTDLPGSYEVLSGHRRLACARILEFPDAPCDILDFPDETDRRRAVLEYNRQRRKTFSQLMREADALETLMAQDAQQRSRSNLRRKASEAKSTECLNSDARENCDEWAPSIECLNSDTRERDPLQVDSASQSEASTRPGRGQNQRTDYRVAQAIGLGGKDLYRQARTLWKSALNGDTRARHALAQVDAGSKSIHAAYKDLRRRDKFTTGFRPTPYDVWSFRHDRAFGISHPGSIPAGIIAHLVHYYSEPDALVVDPMAGGGTTLDVCESMGRRCLAYDINPTRLDIQQNDIRDGFPPEAESCALVFYDPPYHTMLAGKYIDDQIGVASLPEWKDFLDLLARNALTILRPGGFVGLLLANQTEKDLPAGNGYLDHVVFGYQSLQNAGFLPERRVSCPMSGSFLPQHVRRARSEGRMLGQVRDLLIMRKPG